MAVENLKRYRCDTCAKEVIADSAPKGWVRILSTRQQGTEGGRRHWSPQHHGHPPYLWTPSEGKRLPEDAYWCSPKCLTEWVYREAHDIITEASDGH